MDVQGVSLATVATLALAVRPGSDYSAKSYPLMYQDQRAVKKQELN
jgi:hypothetical protein